MYQTIYDADTYFETRFNSSIWSPLSDTDKTALLTTATRMIDTLNYEGNKHLAGQELEFPRGTDTLVPQVIKDACCEIAYALANGFDPEYEMRNLSSTRFTFDNIRNESDPKSIHEARAHGIPSVVAWDLLRPFLRDASTITLVRVD